MATENGRLDYWRKYFRSANSDIFDVIEHAILVAASDCPTEFRVRRDLIAEKLFSCQLARCAGCDLVRRHQFPETQGEEDFGGGVEMCATGSVDKESKVNSSSNEAEEHTKWVPSNYSYDEAEALTEEMEEENQIVGEVLRIKGILVNKEEESAAQLFESLRRLQLMALSVEILKATEIGKAVNGLRKHSSKHIRQLVRMLIDGWKIMVDEWVNATASLTESTSESLNPSIGDDEGLPSPPMDEGVLFTDQITMELSQFFDGMDDDGNFHNSGELDNKRTNGWTPHMEIHNMSTRCQLAVPEEKGQMRKQEEMVNTQSKTQQTTSRQAVSHELSKERKAQELKNQTRQLEFLNQQKKQSSSGIATEPGRLQRPIENKVIGDTRLQQRQELPGIDKKPLTRPQDKFKNSDNIVHAKLEAAKRKLHEGYQQAENAKKQRTIQVMELHDLPKQGLNHRQPFLKPGNHKHWANGWSCKAVKFPANALLTTQMDRQQKASGADL
ncbi:hypothetical protein Taro_053743 [Colocasia esculenta]|uniref:TFIIS N-terminal domain-containing protein n=1 Tax=Colocasia esculenta TaxID=4460 RepID=A0A843XP08_COLES|nr:hypothetical protein [Colocasia esculenta]